MVRTFCNITDASGPKLHSMHFATGRFLWALFQVLTEPDFSYICYCFPKQYPSFCIALLPLVVCWTSSQVLVITVSPLVWSCLIYSLRGQLILVYLTKQVEFSFYRLIVFSLSCILAMFLHLGVVVI